jgi:hypothetical protein
MKILTAILVLIVATPALAGSMPKKPTHDSCMKWATRDPDFPEWLDLYEQCMALAPSYDDAYKMCSQKVANLPYRLHEKTYPDGPPMAGPVAIGRPS